jgi:putative glutamine amidotransferase
MRQAPLILITPCQEKRGTEFCDRSLSLSAPYYEAVAAAGGLPWVLPCLPREDLVSESVRRCRGVLLSGGDDIKPELYRARLAPALRRTLSPPDPERDLVELWLIREVFRQRKPLLAICRGHQLLNVAFGGDLIVDITRERPSAVNHRRLDRKDRFVHDIALAPGSVLADAFGRGVARVNSTHHQAVARPAPGLRATAVSRDGLVEAMELAGPNAGALPFLVSVQFHPERLIHRGIEFLRLFETFVQACRTARGEES